MIRLRLRWTNLSTSIPFKLLNGFFTTPWSDKTVYYSYPQKIQWLELPQNFRFPCWWVFVSVMDLPPARDASHTQDDITSLAARMARWVFNGLEIVPTRNLPMFPKRSFSTRGFQGPSQRKVAPSTRHGVPMLPPWATLLKIVFFCCVGSVCFVIRDCSQRGKWTLKHHEIDAFLQSPMKSPFCGYYFWNFFQAFFK